MSSAYTREHLTGFTPRHATFVGIDSDGCVFPTMDIKQKQCFHTEIIRFWKLERIERAVRECAEFINLYSRWRGTNRFPALLMTFDMLRERADVQASGVRLPDTSALRRYCDSGLAFSNATLKAEVARTGDAELRHVLDWSLAVNEFIERTVKNVPPFRWVRESLEKMAKSSDLIVVSQTPEEALVREWKEHGLDGFVEVIAGQELGTKTEHIAMATKDRYPPERILMVGDALGDLHAAAANHAFFFPVNPGHEEASWKQFVDEAYDRFLAGAYAGAYEQALIARFEALLPSTPPWTKA